MVFVVETILWCGLQKIFQKQGFYRCQSIYDDLVLRIRNAGKKVVIRNVVLSNFRTGGVSTQKSLKKCLWRIKARYGCYRNNGYSPLYIFECVAMELAKLLIG